MIPLLSGMILAKYQPGKILKPLHLLSSLFPRGSEGKRKASLRVGQLYHPLLGIYLVSLQLPNPRYRLLVFPSCGLPNTHDGTREDTCQKIRGYGVGGLTAAFHVSAVLYASLISLGITGGFVDLEYRLWYASRTVGIRVS